MSERRAGAKGRRMGSSRRKLLREDPAEPPAAAPSSGQESPWASEMMQKVQDFLRERDKDQAGFITRSDMEKLQEENLPCSREEMELVFDGLDAAGTGRLSTEEFTAGLWQFLSSQKTARQHRRSKVASRRVRLVIPSPVSEGADSEEQRHFAAFMEQLGTDNVSEEQEIWQLWVKLRQDEPQLLGNLEDFLAKMRHRIQEAKSRKEALELTLNKRVAEHDKEVQQLCEALEQQIQQEQQRLQQESLARSQQQDLELQQALGASEREVQRLVTAQEELEARCRSLRSTQQATSTENQQLEESNRLLEEQLQHLHQQLQDTQERLQTARAAVAQGHVEEPRYRVVAELPSKTPLSPQASLEKSEVYHSKMRIRLGSQGTKTKTKSIHQVVWEMPPAEVSSLGPQPRAGSTEEDPFPEFLKEEHFSDQSSLLREMNDAIAALNKQLKPQALDAPPVLAEAAQKPWNDAEPQMGPEAATGHGTPPGVREETLSSPVGHETFEGDLKEGPATAELPAPDVTQAGASVGAGHPRAQELGAEQGETLEEAWGMIFLQGKGSAVKEPMPRAAEDPQGAEGESREAGEWVLLEGEGEGWMQGKTGWEEAWLLGEAKEAALSQGENLEVGLGPAEAGEAGLAAGGQLGLAAPQEECVQPPGAGLGQEAGPLSGLPQEHEIQPGERLEPEPPSQEDAAPEVTVAAGLGMLEEGHVSVELQGDPSGAKMLPAQQGGSRGAGGEEGEVEVTQPGEAELQPQGESAKGEAAQGGSVGAEVLEEDGNQDLGLAEAVGAAVLCAEGPSPVQTPVGSPDLGGMLPVKAQALELVGAEESQADTQLPGGASPETPLAGEGPATMELVEEAEDGEEGQGEYELVHEPVIDPQGEGPGLDVQPWEEAVIQAVLGVQSADANVQETLEAEKLKVTLGGGPERDLQPPREAGYLDTEQEGSEAPDVQPLEQLDTPEVAEKQEAEDAQEDTQLPGRPGPETLQGRGDPAALQLVEEAEDGARGQGECELLPKAELNPQGERAPEVVQPWEEAVIQTVLGNQSADVNEQETLEAEKLKVTLGGGTEGDLQPPSEAGYLDTEQGGTESPDVQPLEQLDTPELLEMREAEDSGQGEDELLHEPELNPQGEEVSEGVQPWEEAVIQAVLGDQSTDANVLPLLEVDELKSTPGGGTGSDQLLPREAGYLDPEQGGSVAPGVQQLEEDGNQDLGLAEAVGAAVVCAEGPSPVPTPVGSPDLWGMLPVKAQALELVGAEESQADTQLPGGASPETPLAGEGPAAMELVEEAEDGEEGQGECELVHEPVIDPQGEGPGLDVQPWEEAVIQAVLGVQSADVNVQETVEEEKLKVTLGGGTEGDLQPPNEAGYLDTEQGGSVTPDVQPLEQLDTPEVAEKQEAEDAQEDTQLPGRPGPETLQGRGDHAALQLVEEAEDGARGQGECELLPKAELNPQGEGVSQGVQPWEEAVIQGMWGDQSTDANVSLVLEVDELESTPGGGTGSDQLLPREAGYLDPEQGGSVAPGVQQLEEDGNQDLGLAEAVGAAVLCAEGPSPVQTPVGSPDLGGMLPVKAQALELVGAEESQADTQLPGGASPETPLAGEGPAAMELVEEAEDGEEGQGECELVHEPVIDPQGEGPGLDVQPWEEAVIQAVLGVQSADANVQETLEAEKLKVTLGGGPERDLQPPREAGYLDTEQEGSEAPDVQPLEQLDTPEVAEKQEAEDAQEDTQLPGRPGPETLQGRGDPAALQLVEEAEDGARGQGECELLPKAELNPQGERAPEVVQPWEEAVIQTVLGNQSADVNEQETLEAEKLKVTLGGGTEGDLQPPSEAGYLDTEQGGTESPDVQPLEQLDTPELLEMREAEDSGQGEDELLHEPELNPQGEEVSEGVQPWEEAVIQAVLGDQSTDANVLPLLEVDELKSTPGGGTGSDQLLPREAGYLDPEQGGSVAPGVQQLEEDGNQDLGLAEAVGAAVVCAEGPSPVPTPVGSPDLWGMLPVKAQALELVGAEESQADTQLPGGASPETPLAGEGPAAMELVEEAEDGEEGQGECELVHEPVIDPQGEGPGLDVQPWEEAVIQAVLGVQSADVNVQETVEEEKLKVTLGGGTEGDLQPPNEAGYLDTEQGGSVTPDVQPLEQLDTPEVAEKQEAEDAQEDTQLPGRPGPETLQGRGDHAALQLVEEAEDGARGQGECELLPKAELNPQGEGVSQGVQPWEEAVIQGMWGDQSTDANVSLVLEVDELESTPGGGTGSDQLLPREAGYLDPEQGGSVAPGVQQLEEDGNQDLGLAEAVGAAVVCAEGPSPVQTPVGSPDLWGMLPVKAQALELMGAEESQADIQLPGGASPETHQGQEGSSVMQLALEAENGEEGQGEYELLHEPELDTQGEGVSQGVQPREEAVIQAVLGDQSADANVPLLLEVDELESTPGGGTEADLLLPREAGYLDPEQGGSVAPGVQQLEEDGNQDLGLAEAVGAAVVCAEGPSPAQTPVGSPDLGGMLPVKAQALELMGAEESQADTQLPAGASPEAPHSGGDPTALQLKVRGEGRAQGEHEVPQEPLMVLHGAGLGQGDGSGAEEQPGAQADEFSTGRGGPAPLPLMTFGVQRAGVEGGGDVEHPEEDGQLELVQGEGSKQDGLFLAESQGLELAEAEDAQADTQLPGGASPETPLAGEGPAAMELVEEAEDGEEGQGECEMLHEAELDPQEEGPGLDVQPWEEAVTQAVLGNQSADVNVQETVEAEKLKVTLGGGTEGDLQLPSEAGYLDTEQGGTESPDVQPLDQLDTPEVAEMREAEDSRQDEDELLHEPELDPQGEGVSQGVQPWEEAVIQAVLGDQSADANVLPLLEVDELKSTPGEGTEAALQLCTEQGGTVAPDVQPLDALDTAESVEKGEAEDAQADTQLSGGASPETPLAGEGPAAMQLVEEDEEGQGECEMLHEAELDPQGEEPGLDVQPWEEAVIQDVLGDQRADANVQETLEAEKLKVTLGGGTEGDLQPPSEAGYLDTELGMTEAPDVQPLDQLDTPEVADKGEAGDSGQGEDELLHEPEPDPQGEGVSQGVQPWEEAESLAVLGDQSAVANVPPLLEMDELKSMPGGETEAAVQLCTEQGGSEAPDVQPLDQLDTPEVAEKGEEEGLGQGEDELLDEPELNPQGEEPGLDVQPREEAVIQAVLGAQSADANVSLVLEVDELKSTLGGGTEGDLQPPSEAGYLDTEQGGCWAPDVQPLDQLDTPELLEMREAEDSGQGEDELLHEPEPDPQGEEPGLDVQPWEEAVIQAVLGDQSADVNVPLLLEVDELESTPGGGTGSDHLLPREAGYLDPEQGGSVAPGVQQLEEDGNQDLGLAEAVGAAVVCAEGPSPAQTPVGSPDLGGMLPVKAQALELVGAEDAQADTQLPGGASPETPLAGEGPAAMELVEEAEDGADLAPQGPAGMQEGEQSQTPGLEAGLRAAHTADVWEGAAGAHVCPQPEATLHPEGAAEGPAVNMMLGTLTGADVQIPEDAQTLEIPQGEGNDAEDRPLDAAQALEAEQGGRLEAGARSLVGTQPPGMKHGHDDDDGLPVLAPPLSQGPSQISALQLQRMMQEDVLVPDAWQLGGSGQAAPSELQEQVSAQRDQVKLHTAPQQPEKPPHGMGREQGAARPAEPPRQEVPPASTPHTRVQQEDGAENDQVGTGLRSSSLRDAAVISVQPQRQLVGEQSKAPHPGLQEQQQQEAGQKMSPGGPGPVTAAGAEALLGPDHLYNVLFVGDSHVGKTSFLYRLHADAFNPHLAATVGLDYQVKNLVVDNKCFSLRLWDSAGQERYRSVTKQYFRKADGVVLMYDITSEYSFSDVRYWLTCIQEGAEDGVGILLLGNKTDRAAERRVPTEEGERLAKEHQLMFYECSAASGHNVSESMVSFIRLLKAHEDGLKNKVVEEPRPPQKKGCC